MFPTGVAVITTVTPEGQPVGLTCNSFSSVSLEPPLVLFSLRKASSLLGTFSGADGFAINILSQNQDALSGRFAGRSAEAEHRLIAEDDRADIVSTLRHPVTGVVEAYAVNYLPRSWVAIEPAIATALAWLSERLEGEFSVQSRTDDDSVWIIANDPLTKPVRTFIFDRVTQTLIPFYVSRPELEGAPLQPMHPVEIASRDGLTLPCYLTLPPGSDPNGDGKPEPWLDLRCRERSAPGRMARQWDQGGGQEQQGSAGAEGTAGWRSNQISARGRCGESCHGPRAGAAGAASCSARTTRRTTSPPTCGSTAPRK